MYNFLFSVVLATFIYAIFIYLVDIINFFFYLFVQLFNYYILLLHVIIFFLFLYTQVIYLILVLLHIHYFIKFSLFYTVSCFESLFCASPPIVSCFIVIRAAPEWGGRAMYCINICHLCVKMHSSVFLCRIQCCVVLIHLSIRWYAD